MAADSQKTNPEQNAPPLVEVLDDRLRPVAVMPASEARRQLLCYRSLAVLLYDAEGRLYLRRRARERGSPLVPRWDVSARGVLLAGEALLDAATRILEQELGIHAERLRLAAELPPALETRNEVVSVFTLVRPEAPSPAAEDEESGGYAFSPEELGCLLRDFRELVTSRFIHLAEHLVLSEQRRQPR